MNTVPIVRIEIEQMRYALHQMLGEHGQILNEQIQAAVDAFCTPENLQRVVTETANTALKGVVQSEISSFFSYGPGRRAVSAVIKEQLNELGFGEPLPAVYSCIDKGGRYELLGEAQGAGTSKSGEHLMIYRDAQTGILYYRTVPDFGSRMEQVS
jgi:hypothetical protein